MEAKFSKRGSSLAADFNQGRSALPTYYQPTVDEEGILSWANNAGLPNPPSRRVKGDPGDSAYEQAVAGGYVGTEEQFCEDLARLGTAVSQASEAAEQAGEAATAAAGSASTAVTSASSATISAAQAAIKADDAEGRAQAAEQYASNAATSASNAYTQAGLATTAKAGADAAKQAAITAKNSAETAAANAAASSTSASASASSAGNSATQAEASKVASQTAAASVVNLAAHLQETLENIDAYGMDIVEVSGTEVTLEAEAETMYICGELASLEITSLPSRGFVFIVYESGTTATVVDYSGTNLIMPEWFVSEANETVMIGITNGVLGSVQTWAH